MPAACPSFSADFCVQVIAMDKSCKVCAEAVLPCRARLQHIGPCTTDMKRRFRSKPLANLPRPAPPHPPPSPFQTPPFTCRKGSGPQASFLSSQDSQAVSCRRQRAMPYVPADVWPTIARAMLVAEGDSMAAWLRISMVSRNWRESVAGAARSHALIGTCLQTRIHSEVAADMAS